MELVYLWVEDYKNIHKQGFNFSPKFECEFKDDRTLTIKSKEHIKNFFSDNINVTAIVGQNGSGKSNLLNLIFNENIGKKAFMIIKNDARFRVYGVELDKMKYPNNTIEESQIKDTKFECNSLNLFKLNSYKLAFFTPLFQKTDTENKHNYINKKFNLSPYSLLDDYFQDQKIYKILNFENLYSIYESFSIQNNIDFIKNYESFHVPFSLPKSISIYVNLITKDEEYFEEYNFLKSKLQGANTFYEYLHQRVIKNFFHNSFHSFYMSDEENGKIILIEIEDIKYSPSFLNDLESFFLKPVKNKKGKKYYISFLSEQIKDIKIFLKIVKALAKGSKSNNLILSLDEIPDNFIKTYNELIITCTAFLDFNWHPTLSSGQETLLSQFSLFYKYLQEQDRLIFLIDEGESTLHPNWQKSYISYLINFLSSFNKKIHIIISSHSPFILSDLPKENVIFLDTYNAEKSPQKYPRLNIKNLENENCINVSKHIDMNPFGANIHTLLSDGFFIEDGLMGEFSKRKIKEIKTFYEKVIKEKMTIENEEYYRQNRTKFLQIQKIIGETFLKKIIKNYLEELDLILLGKEETINKEIARLVELKESIYNGKS